MDKSEKIIIIIVVSVVVGCLMLALLCAAVFVISDKLFPTELTPTVTTIVITQTPSEAVCSAPVQENTVQFSGDQSLLSVAMETRNTLEGIIIPITDLNLIAEKLTGKTNIPTRLETPPINYEVGDQLDFFKLNEDDESVATSATLRYESDNVYFWAEDDIDLDEDDLTTLMDIFSYEIYPANQAFFGSEWVPGVDNDPHLYILYARELGEFLAGYASSTDCVLTETNPFSNVHEMFYINADVQDITDPYTLSTMAHELQHVIHGYRDQNEELWLNEGFSELATFINGYDAGGFDYLFTLEPDMQLNDWSADEDKNDLNYGASYLFTTYLMDRFGENITRAVVDDSQNGLASLDSVFLNNNLVDPLTGITITADEFFRDWTLANYIHDHDLFEGRYFYSNYPEVPTIDDTQWLNDCLGSPELETVHQYGTDYYEIGCSGRVTLNFKGDETSEILPDDGENSTYMMWSNRADASDMTMTKEFDLSSASGNITLNFDAWYDLETDYDYVFLMAKVEDGVWEILDSDFCTTLNPNGNNYGCGYNGQTYGWQNIIVDLSSFAGQKVDLRFEYITDGALSTEGFAVDNLSIPAIDYDEDFEEGYGGWMTEGFARIRNSVPQTFLVSLITSDLQNPIRKYTVAAGEELNLVIDLDCLDSDPILVISGTSRFTRQSADYSITLTD